MYLYFAKHIVKALGNIFHVKIVNFDVYVIVEFSFTLVFDLFSSFLVCFLVFDM